MPLEYDSVEARGLVKMYGPTRALSGVDLTLAAGVVTVIEGPNGAGKSTLLELLSLLARPTRGSLRFGKHDGWRMRGELRGSLGVLAHAAMLYPDLSGRENLALFARMYGAAATTRDALSERFDVRAFWDRPVRTYSRGQLQRLSLCRALLHAPKLLLLDEPSTGLDLRSTELLVSAIAAERARGDRGAGHARHAAGRSYGRRAGAARARARRGGGVSTLAAAWLVFRKDLAIEARSGEILITSGFFALLVSVMTSLSFYMDDASARRIAPGVLWISIAFSGVLAMGRTFQRERDLDVMRGLLLSPLPRAGIFLGKMLGVIAFLFAVELVLLPAVAVLYHLDLWLVGAPIALVMALGTIGFSAAGTLFAAMGVRTRAKELVLSVVLFPLTAPALLGGGWWRVATCSAERA